MRSESILETDRLTLREFNLNDASFILKLVNTSSWLKFIGDRNVRTLEDAENYLKNGPIASYQDNGFGLSAVILKKINKPIGMCGLVNRESLEDVDIGFALLPEYEGVGYAHEIASATMKYAHHTLGINKIIAITDIDNVSSIKLLNKLGLQYEKTIDFTKDNSVLLFSPAKKTS